MSHADETEGTRRDFIYYATAGAGAITAGAAIWPLINQMNPTADVQALASIEVSISDLEPGTQITVKWLGKPVFIRRRTQAEINEARKVEVGDLPDSDARNNNIGTADATDRNRSLDESGEWLVMMGVCTHLGCVPLGDGAETLEDGFVHATARITTQLEELGKVLHQRTSLSQCLGF